LGAAREEPAASDVSAAEEAAMNRDKFRVVTVKKGWLYKKSECARAAREPVRGVAASWGRSGMRRGVCALWRGRAPRFQPRATLDRASR
jgi:hypothetical protein